MNIRNEMVVALVKEVLGPRNGLREVLPIEEDPFSEYITGVLQPPVKKTDQLGLDERIEDAVDDLIEETSSEEDQHSEGYTALPGIFTPALDPRALAHSIGISFTVEAEGEYAPQIAICATWARYRETNGGWQREPDYFLKEKVDVTRDRQEWHKEHVRLFLRSRQVNGIGWKVSLYLVNETPVANPEKRPHTSEYVFQPQIRVNMGANTRLVPVDIVQPDMNNAPEEERQESLSLSVLYRDHRALARGHMCAAMWKDIDPERPFVDESQRLLSAPFVWTDAEIVPEPHRNRFSPPDVRTELVPVYPIMAPEMDWPEQYGPPPELDPQVLAETWESDALRQALQPLIDGYCAWVAQQRQIADSLESVYQPVVQKNLEHCDLAAHRMQEAVDLLVKDSQAHLAFCFANKAIAMQASWKNIRLKWRPFQIAFILLNLPALIRPDHSDREICDLLWFPTGGGKTEAYLGLTAFTLALRRLRARDRDPNNHDDTGGGVSVISRYTLRLLTIQQFRRALGVITACEILRVQGLKDGQSVGWRPKGYPSKETFLWGKTRFSIGLWVGGGVTPNQLQSIGPIPPAGGGKFLYYAGALDLLKGLRPGYDGPDYELQKIARGNKIIGEGEPAQVTNCPVCDSVLAVPAMGLTEGTHTLHLIYHGGSNQVPVTGIPSPTPDSQIRTNLIQNYGTIYRTLSITLQVPPNAKPIHAETLDKWWHDVVCPRLVKGQQKPELVAVRPSRPGYFILKYPQQGKHPDKEADFEIYCPNPNCELNQHTWVEAVPLNRYYPGSEKQKTRQAVLGLTDEREPGLPAIVGREKWQDIPEAFREGEYKHRARAIPIPACTVDDQVYRKVPSLVIATVDKFARLAYEEESASLFGYVTHYHSRYGYYREGCPPDYDRSKKTHQPHPDRRGNLHCEVPPFDPPDLILQDELHLIEGPLGSMVGLYETAIDLLSQRQEGNRLIGPKYIASTATVRRAESQVQALFARKLFQFPPPAVRASERFFAMDNAVHPLDTGMAGRLYVGVAAPGKGAQTPIVRIWSALLQRAGELKGQLPDKELDPFWTLVGYFNALRELAGALSLYRQDIPQWLRHRQSSRVPDESVKLELSSRVASTDLPSRLKMLEMELPAAMDAVLSTSMFGTGVDVSRLSLMVVHGQPKTTASYIQATGRVGRQTNGLVVTFLRATRPRDLDHYEFFTGYHAALYRYVEPVTVAPFSPRARDRGLGPLAVILLRQGREIQRHPVPWGWRVQQRLSGLYYAMACMMKDRRHESEVVAIPELFEQRAQMQPEGRRPGPGMVRQETESELDRWHNIAQKHPDTNEFVYYEYAVLQLPQRHVVLGDAQHRNRFDQAFENTPNSLRDVEETTGFKDQR
ncbi:MAG: DISARM system helicase DrmA [Chloroflexota bacterium]